MTYSACEVAEKMKLSKDTLLYYEKEGLFPPIQRNKSGHRKYSETDLDWIFLICCLRETGMPIAKIKHYVSLLITQGGKSIPERRNILIEHKNYLQEKLVSFQNLLKLLEKKIDFYDNALSSKNVTEIKCMDYIAEWEKFRTNLGGIKHG